MFSGTLFELPYIGRNFSGNCQWRIVSGICPHRDGDYWVGVILIEGSPLRYSVNIYSRGVGAPGPSMFNALIDVTDDGCTDELNGTLNELGSDQVEDGTFTINPP
jgi:hypothetical protein